MCDLDPLNLLIFAVNCPQLRCQKADSDTAEYVFDHAETPSKWVNPKFGSFSCEACRQPLQLGDQHKSTPEVCVSSRTGDSATQCKVECRDGYRPEKNLNIDHIMVGCDEGEWDDSATKRFFF